MLAPSLLHFIPKHDVTHVKMSLLHKVRRYTLKPASLSPFRAEELFAAAIKASVVNLGVSRSHSFVPGQKSDDRHEEEIIQARPAQENSQSEPEEQSQREILPLTPQSLVGSPSIPDSSSKKVNKRILIELMKGNYY